MERTVFISHSTADKAIADAICHRLEEAGVRCWIAPRDITNSDWAGSIMDGLRRSEVYVVVISRNSIESPEVTKEVTEATHTCRYILPFKVDDEMLSDRLQYHLGPCHWLDAVTPPLEQRIDDLLQRILHLSDEDAVYFNAKRWRLTERILWPHGLFVGREAEIETIASMLEEEHVLFLQGMGGIGKSEIAKGYAKAYRDRYDTIVFTGYTTDLLDLVTGEELPIENLRRADGETPEAYFHRKLQVLKELSSERTLLIVDNFDTDYDAHLDELISGPYHLLITTRNEHEDYPTLPIGPIGDFEKVRQIFTTNYGKKLPDADMAVVDEILRLVNCHTITVELIAKQMKASRRKAPDMLALLKSTGTNTKLREKVKREGAGTGLSSFDYIRQMFQLSGLSEAETHVLCCMTMLPYTGMDISLFAQYCGLESYDEINSLLAKSWLILDGDTDTLMLHPVICDVVKAELAPTPETCPDYIMGLWNDMKNCWWWPAEKRDALAPYVAHIQRTYPEPVRSLWLQYGDFVNVAWICSNFALSIESGHRFYDMTLREFGPDSEQAGFAATWLAGAYHNSGDNDSAEPYYQLGLKHRLASVGPDDKEVGVSYSKLGRCAYLKHDFDAARDYLDKAMGVFQRLYDAAADDAGRENARWHSGDTVVEIERLYMEQGDYETALRYCQESYDIFYAHNNCEVTNSEYSLVDMGICCSALGRYEEAEEYLKRALDLNIRLNGAASVQTVRTREAIADNCRRKGDLEKAHRLYVQLELELERDFGADNPQVRQIREKRESFSRGSEVRA